MMELHLQDGSTINIVSAEQLRSSLSLLAAVEEGGVIELKQSEKETIRAIRDDAYWIVTAKSPGWWFRQTLTTGDWIDPRKRKKKPIWAKRGTFTDAKVRKVFLEFFQREKLSQPITGA